MNSDENRSGSVDTHGHLRKYTTDLADLALNFDEKFTSQSNEGVHLRSRTRWILNKDTRLQIPAECGRRGPKFLVPTGHSTAKRTATNGLLLFWGVHHQGSKAQVGKQSTGPKVCQRQDGITMYHPGKSQSKLIHFVTEQAAMRFPSTNSAVRRADVLRFWLWLGRLNRDVVGAYEQLRKSLTEKAAQHCNS